MFQPESRFGVAWERYLRAIEKRGCRGEAPVPSEKREALFYARARTYGDERVTQALVGWCEDEWAQEEPRRHTFEVLIGQPNSLEHFSALAAGLLPTVRELAEREVLELQRRLCELTKDVLPNSDPEFETTMDLHDAAGKDHSLIPALKERIGELAAIRATMTPEQVLAVREESAKAMREAFSVDLSSVILGGA